jgi:hypothetical protein
MGRFNGRGAWFCLALVVAGCSGSANKAPDKASAECEPGEKRCDGADVKLCGADGATETVLETCSSADSCADGACATEACEPDTKFCDGDAVYRCNETGSGSKLTQSCLGGRQCVETDGDAVCAEGACKAGAAFCVGSVASTCAADGSGPEPGGTDCAEEGLACYQGQCSEQACAPGMRVCQHDDVYLCSASGKEMSLLADCTATESCDGNLGSCRPKLCEPGKAGCDETRIVECNEYGTGWKQAGEDCATDNRICVAGSCKQQICTKNATFCQDGNIHQCDAAGVSSSPWMTCTPAQYCENSPSGSYATCNERKCEPGELVCDENVVKTCAANGSHPDAGEPCGADEFCEEGACKPRGCVPFEYFCHDGDIYYCEFFGGADPPIEVCPSETACKNSGDGVACMPLTCLPGSTACVGNKLGTCAADGSGVGIVSEDCSASDSVCGTDNKCVKVAEDTTAVSESAEVVYPGEFIGNAFDVTATRKLTKIEMNLVLASPRELRWVVFERDAGTFVARVDKVLSNQSGNGFLSSGAFNYTLKAGKRYLIGVAVAGGEAISYYDTAPWSPTVSFGSALGYQRTGYAANLGLDYYLSDRLYYMRLTTEAP